MEHKHNKNIFKVIIAPEGVVTYQKEKGHHGTKKRRRSMLAFLFACVVCRLVHICVYAVYSCVVCAFYVCTYVFCMLLGLHHGV